MTSNPYCRLPEMKLLSNRLFTLVFVITRPPAPVLVSTIPEPPQWLTSTCSTSACQLSTMMPSVRPDPSQATVRSRTASGSPVVAASVA